MSESKPSYFYKLGHCQPLALAEFASLTGQTELNTNNDFLLSSKFVEIQKTGSLIFSGQVLESTSSQDFFANNPLKKVAGVFDSKKLGLAILTKKYLNTSLTLKTIKAQG